MSRVLEAIGWIGSVCLATCSIPELYDSIQKGHNSSSPWFLYLWLVGEVFLLIYVVPKREYPLIFNYLFNIILISGLVYYNAFV